jgi:FkbM family methyltransferase
MSKKLIKALLRSGNLGFASDMSGYAAGPGIGSFKWRGMTFHYRRGTSDTFIAYECLLKGKRNAYYSTHLPPSDRVKTIVDVGANVGASVLYWRERYPSARILAFEPVPDNFSLLKMNAGALANVEAYEEALGDADGSFELVHSPAAGNEGGWSMFQRGAAGGEARISIRVRESGARLQELGVTGIDILKVDTEGAEKRIIRGLGAVIRATNYICGELHGERDFELLDYLEQQGFGIGCRKQAGKPLFNFEAVRRVA